MAQLTKNITLEAGAVGTITFSFTPSEVGLYTIKGNGVVVQFEVLPVPVVDIEVTNIQVPSEVTLSETVQIVVTCENFGNVEGTEEQVIVIE